MNKINHANPCNQVQGRRRLWAALKERVSRRLSDHIAACPHCQKRLALAGRVELAFELLKAQRHEIDLLARANAKAIGVLKHSLRSAPQTAKLRRSRPDCSWLDKKSVVIEKIFNIAACLFVIAMVRMGVASSFLDVQNKGKTALHHYYARNLDSQTADDLFS
jgi:hypothetical protein